MNTKGIEGFHKIHAEHLEKALAYARQNDIPEEFVRNLFGVMLVHVLMTCPNAPRTHFASSEERNRYIAKWVGVSEQKAGWLYDKYVEAREKHPYGWPDLSKAVEQIIFH